MTLHMEQKQEKERAARERVEILEEENVNKKRATEASIAKLRALEKSTHKSRRLKDLAQKKINEAEAKRRGYEEDRDTLKTKIHTLNSLEFKAGAKNIESLRRTVGKLKREKDILDRKHISSDRASSLIFDLSKANESTLRNLSVDREAMKQSIKGLRANIEQLAGERERAENDSLEHTRRWQERVEELKSQGIQVGDLQKKISVAVARLKQQQNLYEAVRSDRNVYSKNLIETQVKEHFHHHNVDKDKESLRNEVTKVKKQIVSGEHIALHQRSELQKLTRIVQEADEERQRQAGDRGELTVASHKLEKEKLYVELKKILGRQPGPEVSEQLAVYQDNLKHKVKQMRAMEAELGMYKQQVDLFKSDIEAANEAMRTLRQRWIAGQRRRRPGGEEAGGEGSYETLTGPRVPHSPATAAATDSSGSLSLSKDGGDSDAGGGREDLIEDRPQQFEASSGSAVFAGV